MPGFRERIARRRFARLGALPGFHKSKHLADSNRIRGPRQQIATLSAAARLDEAALFQSGENQLQKLLRNLLPASDIGNPDGLSRLLQRQIEDGMQRIVAFDRDVHARWRNLLMPTRDCTRLLVWCRESLRQIGKTTKSPAANLTRYKPTSSSYSACYHFRGPATKPST